MALLDYASFVLNEIRYAETKYRMEGGSDRATLNTKKEYAEFVSKLVSVGADPDETYGITDYDKDAPTVKHGGGGITITIEDSKGKRFNLEAAETNLKGVLKKKAAEGAKETDTDTKEGMVVYYYYNQDVDLATADLSAAAGLVSNIPAGDLFPSVTKKISQWILSYDDSGDDQANDWKSSGNAMADFASAGYRLDRSTEILVKIRTKAGELTGLAKDNWCPGDVYLYDMSAQSNIIEYVNAAQNIGELNLLFSNAFSPRSSDANAIGSIIAVSLKQAQARLGKAKEYLTKLSPGDTKYNLTAEELDKCKTDTSWARLEIGSYQEKIQVLGDTSNIHVAYTPSNVEKINDAKLAGKLAAVKLAYHLLSLPKENAESLDSNLLACLKFGLKQSDPAVNPPYFKISGSTKGSASIESVKGSDTFALLVGGLDNVETKLSIVDSDTRLDILLFYYVSIGDIAYEIRLRVGGGGNKQAALEFEGKFPLGNIVSDPNETIAAVNDAFVKNSR